MPHAHVPLLSTKGQAASPEELSQGAVAIISVRSDGSLDHSGGKAGEGQWWAPKYTLEVELTGWLKDQMWSGRERSIGDEKLER